MAYNLFVRSEYSMFKSLIAIDKLIKYAKEQNFARLAIIDDAMYASYKFYQACISCNIKPLIGAMVKWSEWRDANLALYAISFIGYQNLMALSSINKVNQKVTNNDLLKYAKGLVCVVSLKEINDFKHHQHISYLSKLFNHFYLGVNIWQMAFLDDIKEANIIQAKLVAFNEVCYFNKDDKDAYQTLIALKNKTTNKKFTDDFDYHFLTKEELTKAYFDDLSILNNVDEIFALNDFVINKNQKVIPEYSSEDGQITITKIASENLIKLFSNHPHYAIYQKRLQKELAVIKQLKFADYFLIVRDYVLYAKESGILVGPGRGSAASSLVSYLLGITEVDPIKYQLLFERFLNVERVSMPDIDIDFPDDRRDEVIKYVQNRYGMLRVAHIATFSTFGLKNTIKEVSHIFNLSKIKENEILKCLKSLNDEDIESFLKDEALISLMNDYPDVEQVIKIATQIANLPKALSTHPAGIIIASDDIIKFSPIEMVGDGLFQTAYDAHDLEQLGLLKMDFLSLRNLNVINRMIKAIKQDYPTFKLPKEFNDAKTFAIFSSGKTNGIFQFESESMKKMLQKIKITSFEDLCQAMALNRPGPLSEIDTYALRKENKEQISYLHPSLEKILKSTYGIILFQEQIILIARTFANYTLGEADILRRAISKKQRDVMINERVKFVRASINNGYLESAANEIFDYIEKFADYGFPRAHSVSYSMIAYLMAYLKANYPAYFYAVLLEDDKQTLMQEVLIKEMQQIGLKILNPDINLSNIGFIHTKEGLVLPLGQIKGVTKSFVQLIINERLKGSFISFDDFIKRLGNVLPLDVTINLIYASALDCFKISKKSMIENLTKMIERSKYSFVTNVSEINYSLEEYGYGYLLNKEKEVLGVNLKYNFFKQYQKMYDHHLVTRIKDITKDKVSILAKIIKINVITTKNNEIMAFMEVMDDSDSIEIIVFPSEYPMIKEYQSDMLLLIEGVVRINKSEKQIVLNNCKQV